MAPLVVELDEGGGLAVSSWGGGILLESERINWIVLSDADM